MRLLKTYLVLAAMAVSAVAQVPSMPLSSGTFKFKQPKFHFTVSANTKYPPFSIADFLMDPKPPKD
ncbi:hypothetical protein K2X33_05295, partial [bacterium]|nr:hypothetical protein [bacterium]